MSNIKSYKDLLIWQKGILLSKSVYDLTKTFPKEEMYGITNQMRRASVSVSSNIAEGFGRSSTQNYLQHLRIARGSLYELDTQLTLSESLNLIDNMELYSDILDLIEEEGKMINSFINKLKEKI